VPLSAATLPELLAAAAERYPQNLALISPTERWTYRDLAAETARVASGLTALGIAAGERIGVLLPNWPQFFAAVYGIQAAGAVAVCMSTMATAKELREALAHADVRRLIYTPHFLKHDYESALGPPEGEPWSDAAPRLETRIAFVPNDPSPEESRPGRSHRAGALDFARIAERPADGAAFLRACDRSAPDGAAAVYFTSGSTARPKAVVHSHGALVHQALVCSEGFGLDEHDRLWGCLPMFFTGGFVAVALTSLASGAAVVLLDHFEASAALDALERERVTFYTGWQLAPAICDHPTFAERDLVVRKGIYVDHPAAERLLQPDHVAVGVYGMSETATFVCQARFDDPPELRRRGFGRPLPGVELRIVDPESGAPLPCGAVGEVLVKGPSMMLGYVGQPLSELLDDEGFLHTGDLGYLDESGTLRFGGRLKEVIKTAGVNVAAAEVEACLEALPEIRNAYVVPVPHEVRGENVAAFLVADPGAVVDVGRVLAHCRRELASYKVPRHLFLLEPDAVPRTGTQKVSKPLLKTLAAERAGGPHDLVASSPAAGR
jgi:fatty-acyl-CoA synthase